MPLPALVFDINGTLLRTDFLARDLRRIFGSRITLSAWWTEVLFYALAADRAGEFIPLTEVVRRVLRMSAEAQQVRLRPEHEERLMQSLTQLPAFREVPKALDALRKAGFRLVALSNSTTEGLRAQLDNSRLSTYFDSIISVDQVRHYKPAQEVYAMAASVTGADPSDLMMVAAHPWDLIGARQVGYRTAFLARKGTAWLPGELRADFQATDLQELAKKLISDLR